MPWSDINPSLMAATVLGQAGDGSGRSCPLCLAADHSKEEWLWGSVSSPNLVLIPPPLLVQFLPPVAHFTAQLHTPRETPSAADLTVVGALGPPAVLTISVLAAPSQDMGRSTAQTPRSSRGPKSVMQDLLGCQNQPTHPRKELNFKVQPQLASLIHIH